MVASIALRNGSSSSWELSQPAPSFLLPPGDEAGTAYDGTAHDGEQLCATMRVPLCEERYLTLDMPLECHHTLTTYDLSPSTKLKKYVAANSDLRLQQYMPKQ